MSKALTIEEVKKTQLQENKKIIKKKVFSMLKKFLVSIMQINARYREFINI